MSVERLRGGDLMQWLSDRGPVPQHVGALLVFDGPCPVPAEQLRVLVRDRLSAVPALRRRPVRPPFGCGGWLWLNDPGRPDAQVDLVPVGRRDLCDVAAEKVMRPLPRERPPWAAHVLIDGEGGRALGVLVCVHHVLADGVAGMALLAGLLDGATAATAAAGTAREQTPPESLPPESLPPRRALVADAWRRRLTVVRLLPALPGQLRAARAELGGGGTPKASPSTLNRPTGPRREVAVLDVDLPALRAAAHAARASVNDALLVAVAATLAAAQAQRCEHLEQIVASVPVAARPAAGPGDPLGNTVGVLPVAIPTTGPARERLAAVTAARTSRLVDGRHGASMPLVLMAFRVLSVLHLVQRYATHQRLVNTFVTNIRGPANVVRLAGAPVARLLPFVVNQGNVTVSFAAASYAGRLDVVVTTDPDAGLRADDIAEGLRAELGRLAG